MAHNKAKETAGRKADATSEKIVAIKYMGTADERSIDKGENSGRTLPQLCTKLVWNVGNDWIVEVKDHPCVYDAWWEYLASLDGDFKSVDPKKGTPLNDHQATFLGMRGNPNFNRDLDQLSVDVKSNSGGTKTNTSADA